MNTISGRSTATTESKHIKTYYESLGEGSDKILRCQDCKRLILHSYLVQKGSCKCGNRRMIEVRTLTLWEWFKIWTSIIDFPNRDRFLAEFKVGK